MLGSSYEPVFRPAIPQARNLGSTISAFISAPCLVQSLGPLASSSPAGSSTPHSTSFFPARAVISATCSGVARPAGANLGDCSRWKTVRSVNRHQSINRLFGEGPLNVAATGAASEQEAFYISMSAPDMGGGAAAPAAAAKSPGGRKFPGFPPVAMDPDATQKFAEIVVRCGEEGSEEESVIIRGLKSAEYHKDAGAPTMQQLREAGLHARITGGGRIKHNSSDKSIFIFGYSMQFGPADLARVAEMCREAYPDYDVTFNKGGY